MTEALPIRRGFRRSWVRVNVGGGVWKGPGARHPARTDAPGTSGPPPTSDRTSSGVHMPSTPADNENGHRRRQLVKRVKAEESDCALCEKTVDMSLGFIVGEHGKRCPSRDCAGWMPHPMRGEVDEDVPRARGAMSTRAR